MSTVRPERTSSYANADDSAADIAARIMRIRELRASRFQATERDLFGGSERDEARAALGGHYTDRDEE